MNKKLLILLAIITTSFTGLSQKNPVNTDIIPGRINIKFKPDMAARLQVFDQQSSRVQSRFGIPAVDSLTTKYHVQGILKSFEAVLQNEQYLQRRQRFGLHLWYTLQIPDTLNAEEVARAFALLKGTLENAEPEYKKIVNAWTPNDPRYDEQWHYHNTGQNSGTTNADIDLPEAWDIEKGDSSVIVGVTDGGVDTTHPDLRQNLWKGNGYNFVTNSSSISPFDHGCHVAGTVAGVSNNGIGISGIAGGDGTPGTGARIMSCQVFSNNGYATAAGFANTFIWAADHGAVVSQNSWTYTLVDRYEQIVLDAIDYFIEYGGGSVLEKGLVIFAGGNNNISAYIYPGAYERVINVAATNNEDRRAGYSNYGPQFDISAPGGEIIDGNNAQGVLSTISVASGSYTFISGTSMAAPHVSGVAALIISKGKGRFSADDVKEILLSQSDNHYGVNGNYTGQLGTGRLNAYKCLQKTVAIIADPVVEAPAGFTATQNGGNITLQWTRNSAADGVMIAVSTDSTKGGYFGLPYGNPYNVNGLIDGKGLVVYKGSGTSFTYPTSDGKYYFKIWSVNAQGKYSMGITSGKGIRSQGFLSATVTSPTVTQPTCTISTGTIVVNATGSGILEYSIDNGANWQLPNTFSGLVPGSYNIKVRQQADPANSTVYSDNPVVINAAPAVPATPTVMLTQPTCTVATGTITVNSPTGAGITYSINGSIYQASNFFSNVALGNYSVTAKSSSGCISAAAPITVNAAPADNQPPSISLKLNPTVFLTAANTYTVQLSDVLQSVSDNCDPNPAATVSTLNVTCSNFAAGGNATPHQPFVANSSTGNQDAHGSGIQGMDFRVNAASGIIINQLGAFDHQADGLNGTQPDGNGNLGIRVGIFSKATHAIVPGLDVVITGNGDAFADNYRYKNIPAVTLAAGDYLIVAQGYNASELMGNSYLGDGPYPVGDDAAGAISYLNSAFYDDAAGFNYPANSVNTGTSNVFKGATFTYTLNQSNIVTITATDVSGNQSQASTTVSVVDTFYVLTTKDITVNLNSNGQATIQPADVLLSLKNNCGINVTGSTLQVNPSSFICSNTGSTLSTPHHPFIANSSTGNQDAHGSGIQGMDFRVNAASGIIINQLGAFDHQADGLNGTQPDGNGNLGIRVGIFSKATHAIVPGLDVVITGNGDAFADNYRYKNIPAVTLAAGDYLIVAQGYNASELMGNSYLGDGPYPVGDDAAGAISYLNSAFYDDAAGFNYPANSVNTGTSNVFKGATFTYTLNQNNHQTVTLTATDMHGNVSQQTAVVTLTNPSGSCIPAPVMAFVAKGVQTDVPVLADKVRMSIKVYPDPSSGQFTVQLSNLKVPKVSLQIMDANGQVIEQKTASMTGKTPSLSIPVDISKHATGIYLIKVISTDGVQTTKVVVSR